MRSIYYILSFIQLPFLFLEFYFPIASPPLFSYFDIPHVCFAACMIYLLFCRFVYAIFDISCFIKWFSSFNLWLFFYFRFLLPVFSSGFNSSIFTKYLPTHNIRFVTFTFYLVKNYFITKFLISKPTQMRTIFSRENTGSTNVF